VGADDLGAAVLDQVDDVLCGQPLVERHHDRTELWHGIELLEHRMGIRGNQRNTVTRADAKRLQRRRPAIGA
jgi:hypothetical protein